MVFITPSRRSNTAKILKVEPLRDRRAEEHSEKQAQHETVPAMIQKAPKITDY
jgi:hypothetical protein